EERVREAIALVPVIQVVRVLPDVQRQERHLRRGEGGVRVGRRNDVQLVAVGYQPDVAAAELPDGRFLEALAKSIEAAEGLVDPGGEGAARRSVTVRRHAVPQ